MGVTDLLLNRMILQLGPQWMKQTRTSFTFRSTSSQNNWRPFPVNGFAKTWPKNLPLLCKMVLLLQKKIHTYRSDKIAFLGGFLPSHWKNMSTRHQLLVSFCLQLSGWVVKLLVESPPLGSRRFEKSNKKIIIQEILISKFSCVWQSEGLVLWQMWVNQVSLLRDGHQAKQNAFEPLGASSAVEA